MKQIFLAFLCITVFGCTVDDNGIGYSEKEAEYKWDEWGNNQLVSIVDDSLAVLAIYKFYFKEWKDCGLEGCTSATKTADSRAGLFLVNYRVTQKPLLGDTLDHDLKVVKDYFRDSSVLVLDTKNNKFGFWKIGTKLNTKTGQIESFEFSGEYEWLSDCNDFSYIENKIACIKRNDTAQNLELVVNGEVTDTNRWWYSVSNWYGNYIKEGNGNLSEGELVKIDTENFKFDKALTPIWVKNSRINNSNYRYEIYSAFQENSSDFNSNTIIRYYPKDLIKVGY